MAKIPTLGSLSSANCQAMAHYRRYEAHNHRQRDKYWPTADASLFERRRRATFYESVTTPMVSERQHRDAVWISTDAA